MQIGCGNGASVDDLFLHTLLWEDVENVLLQNPAIVTVHVSISLRITVSYMR